MKLVITDFFDDLKNVDKNINVAYNDFEETQEIEKLNDFPIEKLVFYGVNVGEIYRKNNLHVKQCIKDHIKTIKNTYNPPQVVDEINPLTQLMPIILQTIPQTLQLMPLLQSLFEIEGTLKQKLSLWIKTKESDLFFSQLEDLLNSFQRK